MAISVFDLFKIGIGPSSSHTVGPMKAAYTFAQRLESRGLLDRTDRIKTSLYGSLAHTGRGHGTDKAVMLGLQIAGVMMANEQTWYSREKICQGLTAIRQAMHNCMERGYRQQGVLPGGLKVERRVPQLYRELRRHPHNEDRMAVWP